MAEIEELAKKGRLVKHETLVQEAKYSRVRALETWLRYKGMRPEKALASCVNSWTMI
jgi:hypothetical protein